MERLEQRLLHSIRQIILQDKDIRRRQIRPASARRIQTKWDMYRILRDQSRFLLEDIRAERRRENRKQMYPPYFLQENPAVQRPSKTEYEMENIIRIITKMEYNHAAYAEPVKSTSATGSLIGYFVQCEKEISKSLKSRGGKKR